MFGKKIRIKGVKYLNGYLKMKIKLAAEVVAKTLVALDHGLFLLGSKI